MRGIDGHYLDLVDFSAAFLGPDGRCLEANAQMCATAGVACTGCKVLDLLLEGEQLEQMLHLLQRTIRSGLRNVITCDIKNVQGRRIPAVLSVSGMNGNVVLLELLTRGFFLLNSGFDQADACHFDLVQSIEEVDRAVNAVVDTIIPALFESRELRQIRTCMYESLINAVRHGNRSNPHKVVRVVSACDSARLRLSVADEGEGFDWHSLPDPRLPQNLFKPSGRGLFIIKKFCDEVQFNSKGNRLLFTKLVTQKGVGVFD